MTRSFFSSWTEKQRQQQKPTTLIYGR